MKQHEQYAQQEEERIRNSGSLFDSFGNNNKSEYVENKALNVPFNYYTESSNEKRQRDV